MRKLALLIITILMLVAIMPAAAQDDDMMMPDFITHTECEVDLTGENINVVHLGDISSPGYSPITLPLLAGLADGAAYFNNLGGICGATIGQENFDTGGDPSRTSAGYDQLSADDPDLLVLYSSGDSELLRPTLAEDEIPVIISAGSLPGLYGENGDEPGWVYATNPLYADQFADFCDYVAANPETFPEPVIGYMGWGGPLAAFGLAAYTDEATGYCEDLGIDVIDSAETFLPTATAVEVSTLVENHIEAGATIIYVNALASGQVRVAEAVDFIGFSDELELGTVNWGMDTSVALLARDSLGADGLPVVNGMYGSLPFRWWSEVQEPGIQLLIEQADANERPPEVRGISYILGFTLVDIYIELYTQAANQVAAEQGLTDASEIVAAIDGPLMRGIIEGMNYDSMGLFTVDFQGGELRAVNGNRIVQMAFPTADMSGVATSGDDALGFPLEDGTTYYPAIIVPLTEFDAAPDTRAMMSME